MSKTFKIITTVCLSIVAALVIFFGMGCVLVNPIQNNKNLTKIYEENRTESFESDGLHITFTLVNTSSSVVSDKFIVHYFGNTVNNSHYYIFEAEIPAAGKGRVGRTNKEIVIPNDAEYTYMSTNLSVLMFYNAKYCDAELGNTTLLANIDNFDSVMSQENHAVFVRELVDADNKGIAICGIAVSVLGAIGLGLALGLIWKKNKQKTA